MSGEQPRNLPPGQYDAANQRLRVRLIPITRGDDADNRLIRIYQQAAGEGVTLPPQFDETQTAGPDSTALRQSEDLTRWARSQMKPSEDPPQDPQSGE